MSESYDHMMGSEQDVSTHAQIDLSTQAGQDLMSAMYSARAENDRTGKFGKSFWDGGVNIPGVMKGKNDTYRDNLRRR